MKGKMKVAIIKKKLKIKEILLKRDMKRLKKEFLESFFDDVYIIELGKIKEVVPGIKTFNLQYSIDIKTVKSLFLLDKFIRNNNFDLRVFNNRRTNITEIDDCGKHSESYTYYYDKVFCDTIYFSDYTERLESFLDLMKD